MDINDFVKKIHKKVKSVIKYRQLFDVITLINNYMYEEIINDRPIYIDQLGVITQTVPLSKKTWSRWQNKYIMSNPTKKLVFRPHSTFTHLIQSKRKNLQNPGK